MRRWGIMRCWNSMFKQNCGTYLSLILGICVSYYLIPIIREECDVTPFEINKLRHLKEKIISKIDDDYEPHINLAGKPQRAKKIPKNLVRPRYYSSELGIREKLFVGVLTSGKTIRTLAVAINRTSAHLVDKMMFFIDAKSAEKANVITLKLPGIVGFVDSQKILKPFHMLKYLTDNFLEEYDFFFITKDTTYINGKLLSQTVKKISVSQDIHAGGLKVGDGSSFCSFDGGILLSNSILRKIQPSLDWCVKNAFSDADDDNVGRCILHATQISCQDVAHGIQLKSVSLPVKDQLKAVNDLEVSAGIAYYKISSAEVFYTLHYHLSKANLLENTRTIGGLKKKIDVNTEGLAWPPGSYPPKVPATRFDLLRWDYFNETTIFFPTSFQTTKPLVGADLLDVQRVMNASVNWLMEKYKWEMKFSRLVNGYRRFDPSRGLDYILDLAFKDLIGKDIVKRVEVCKPLGKVELLGVPYVTENSRISLVLPVQAENKQQTLEFMKVYARLCMATSELTFLLLILLYEPDAPGKGHSADVFKDIKDLALSLSSKHRKDYSKIAWISIKVPKVSEGAPPLHDGFLFFAIMDLALVKLPSESMVLITDSNMEVHLDYLNRVRMNTIIGTQVYSPIPFTEFDPEIIYSTGEITHKPELEIHKNTGHFDTYNTRHISFYTTDYTAARNSVAGKLPVVKADKDIVKLALAFERLAGQKGWASSVLDMFSRWTGVSVLRSVEPSLRLRHPLPRPCANLRWPMERELCAKAQAFNMATRSQLASYLLNATKL